MVTRVRADAALRHLGESLRATSHRASELLQGPAGTALITVMGAVSGLLGSVWTDQIKSAFPFCCWLDFNSFSLLAFTFWASLALTALLYASRQRAVDSARAAILAQWSRRTDDLEGLVRTVPPPYILQRFNRRSWNAWRVLDDVRRTPDATVEDIEKAIRTVLGSVAQLAHEFDREPPGSRYAANVMLYTPAPPLSESEQEGIRPILRFAADDLDIARLRGVLILHVPLSATHLDHESPDEALAQFALPVPEHHMTTDQKYRALPGAPLTFVTERVEWYADTGSLGDWCRQHGAFAEDLIQDLEAFFASQPNVKSFISYPLAFPERPPIGVLNVHTNRTGILRTLPGGELVQQFSDIIGPFNAVLLELLALLNARGSSRGA